ncbi:Starch-binding associating with outer membrane [Flaviramulus basaltis]|uniref:Starch-binding associating with outer membrane n=1 Tax=Flaviramulus basaltis TaxID=369401 RepID=A0A1K2IM70_9FLAO|nr:RagB/SusD family nutrient uptake outer membrane protein [Flaviramulus basaltis]SFZ93463.1 Starch-binding associating with outer membrane [Flaviramulus basaltis]
MKKIIYNKNMKKTFLSVLAAAALIVATFQSCNSDLEVPLQGTFSADVIPYDVDWVTSQVTTAYGMLDGNLDQSDPWRSAASNWIYGEVSSDNAYKGSTLGDQPVMNGAEWYQATANENNFYGYKWNAIYEGVARANEAIRGVALGVEKGNLTAGEAASLEAEARFLRAHYHFEAKKMWENIPYVFETDTESKPNTLDSWTPMEDDFQYAIDNLPPSSRFTGGANSWSAKAYLAKVHMYQLDYAAAKPILNDVITSGPYSLAPKYSDNFNALTNNSSESIFAVQNTVGDGPSNDENGNWGDALNLPNDTPVGGGGSCCGFYQPSQNLVNAYKTDASGLPLLDTFNNTDVTNDDGLADSAPFTPYTGELDPRLDWKVGRRGLDINGWGIMPGASWIRDPANGGPYIQKVTVWRADQMGDSGIDAPNAWAGGVSSMNTNIIRYAEVLLWRAEIMAAEAEGDMGASLVDEVRSRAANPADFYPEVDANGDATGDPAANYVISTYGSFASQAEAIKAVAYEYRIETALEGHRFFDLVRRGDAATVLSAYLTVEKTKRDHLSSASFTPGKSERYPIPNQTIAVSNGQIVQNTGY